MLLDCQLVFFLKFIIILLTMKTKISRNIPVVNLETGLPTVDVAKRKLKTIIDNNNHKGQNKDPFITIIHGWGSTDAGGGRLRVGLRRCLAEMKGQKTIKNFIPGEDFKKGNPLIEELKGRFKYITQDQYFGRENWGITVVVFNK